MHQMASKDFFYIYFIIKNVIGILCTLPANHYTNPGTYLNRWPSYRVTGDDLFQEKCPKAVMKTSYIVTNAADDRRHCPY